MWATDVGPLGNAPSDRTVPSPKSICDCVMGSDPVWLVTFSVNVDSLILDWRGR